MCLLKYISFLIIISNAAYCQDDVVWTAFEDVETKLFGFKDADGNIKVQPKYVGFMLAAKHFSKIIAVMEEDNTSYYLLKNGRKIGLDSLYTFDTAFDCESEGYIRFKDQETDKVGIFNHEGNAVIPAEYDVITPVRDGLVIGLKGAEKKYYTDSLDEHWSWEGGIQYLIDTENHVLVENIIANSEIDFHSLIVEDTRSKDSCRESYVGVNGKYYSFNNNEKLFKVWFVNTFLKNLAQKTLEENSYYLVIYWTDKKGWYVRKSSDFIQDNYTVIIEKFSKLEEGSSDYLILPEDFIVYPDSMTADLAKYMNNCGELKHTQYPLMDVVINYKNIDNDFQDHFGFLKTEDGFKLLNVSIMNAALK